VARKTATIVIDAEGRDQGKHFLLTEMPASVGERWALRAFKAMLQSGVELPEGIEFSGLVGLATIALKSLASIPYTEAEQLLAEMMECVQIIPDPARPMVFRPLIEDDIEEIRTRLKLRSEVIELHAGFSVAGALSTWATSATQINQTSPST
jgi:hypothetical protein